MIEVDADEALARVKSGHHVFVQGACAAPTTLLAALARRASSLEDVQVIHLHTEGPAPHLDPALAGRLRHLALFVGASARPAIADGRADYLPALLGDIPRLFTSGALPVDVALVHVSPPDAAGRCSLGVSVDVTPAALSRASCVIAQINPRMPVTRGDSWIHVSRIDYAVRVDDDLPEVHVGDVGDLERRIAEHTAPLVRDGATLQLGIGAIPAAVAAALTGHRDLGMHTEMFTDAILDLVQRGVLTGACKPIDSGRIVSSFVMGTRALFDFVHENPAVELRGSEYTNSVDVIRQFPRMTAINSAIEIDLTGQVCADSIGHRIYSGVGGQMDFIRGAVLADGGCAIVALPSTALGGTRSRIVATLAPGSGVVTTRAHVDWIVTEWGAVQLRGRGIRDRARLLLSIAHPEHRDALAREARALHLVD